MRDNGCGVMIDCGPCNGRALGIDARHLVFDSSRDLLYVTVASADARYSNQLVALRPPAMSVAWTAPMGSDPNLMALSDDFSTLWVGIDGAYAVRSVDLDTHVTGPLVRLLDGPRDLAGEALGIAVLPGQPQSVAVGASVRGSSGFLGVTIYDRGVPRPGTSPEFNGPTVLTNGPVGLLYGCNGRSTSGTFYVVEIRPTGLFQTGYPGYLDCYGTRLQFAGGLLFASDGLVVDLSAPSRPQVAGHLAFGGVVAATADGRTAFVVSRSISSGRQTLRRLNVSTFAAEASSPAQIVNGNELRDLTILSPSLFAVVGRASLTPTTRQDIYVLTPTFE